MAKNEKKFTERENLVNGVNYNEKEWRKILWSPKSRPMPTEFLPYGDRLKGVELVEQVLATRDDTRLSLHVMHEIVALHWPIAGCVRWAYHTQMRKTLAVRRPWWFPRLVSEIIAFVLPPFLFPKLGRFYRCECYSAPGSKNFHFTFTFAGL